MSKIIRWGCKKIAGFSLLELMVVVAILGVLATVAVPRFNIFRARARQSEAKSSLGVVYTLQEAFNIEHENYYNGNNSTWGGDKMDAIGERDGYTGGGSSSCTTASANKLGFRLANCTKARYGYWIAGADEDEFLAVAYATSDNANTGARRIFPGCDGKESGGVGVNSNDDDASRTGIEHCSATFATNTSAPDGDAWCMDEGRKLENYRDITEYCEN